MNNSKKIIYIVLLVILSIVLTIYSSYKDKNKQNCTETLYTNTNAVTSNTMGTENLSEENKSYNTTSNNESSNTTNVADNNIINNITTNTTAQETKMQEEKKAQNVVQDNKKTQVKASENSKTQKNQNENLTNSEQKSTKQGTTIKSTYNTDAFDEKGYLNHYPDYACKYGTLKISKIGVNAPIFFGASDEILLKAVAHDPGSYFPGENGSIIMCGHNYKYNFNKFGSLKSGDIIEVETSYGDYFYKLYDTKIIEETEFEKLPIQRDKEILMIYTCYPFANKEHTKFRYVLYSEKI